MHELYELKEKLCDELKEYGGKDLSAGTLDVVDKLAHAVKNIDKIIEVYEDEGEGYSSRSYPDGMGGSYRYSREGRSMNRNGGSYRSYARGRMNARRDSMGRYSSDDGQDIEAVKAEARRLVEKIEQM